jgi:hypothetical protein
MTVIKRAVLLFLTPLLISAGGSPTARVHTGRGVYDKTVERWTRAVGNASFESTSWIFGAKANGHRDKQHVNHRRDTIFVVPESTPPNGIVLIVWFHGLRGFSEKTFQKRLIPQMEQLLAEGHAVVMAIPEMPWSINTTTSRGRQGRVWRRPRALEDFVQDVMDHLQIWSLMRHGKDGDPRPVKIIFAGHSAGGSALSAAAQEGSLCRLNPAAVVWSDASYSKWLDQAWHGCLRQSPTNLHILVRKWDEPHHNAERFIELLKGPHTGRITYRIFDREQWTHGRIGNQALLISSILLGRP